MRLFVAVWPPAEVQDLIAGIERPPVDGLRWTTADQWHVTLRFLGDCDEARARSAFARITAAAASAAMGPVTGRFGRRILHVPVAGLDRVAAATAAATGHVGVPAGERDFDGHLTLARVRDTRRRPPVDLAPLTGWPLAATWPVTEIALVRSVLGPGGARYDTLATRPLGLPPGP